MKWAKQFITKEDGTNVEALIPLNSQQLKTMTVSTQASTRSPHI